MLQSFKDNRGELYFPIKNSSFLPQECTISINKKNVFRGLHCNTFSKLVTCIQGSILDVIINLDINSDNYLIPQYYNLSLLNELNQVLIPPNHAHGFLTLEENTIVLYHFSSVFKSDETTHIHYLDPYINLKLPTLLGPIIISDKDNICNFIKPVDYIVIGSSGYLGGHIMNILKIQGKNVISISERLNDISAIRNKLSLYKPNFVINAAGLTGKPNINWCDDNKEQTIETNITYQLTLCDICKELNIHLTIFGSGGIYNTPGVKKECDIGDYYDKFYSECRIYLENIVKNYTNVLYLRINYPLSSCSNPKNLLTKLKCFTKISDSKFSITCIDSLFPLLSSIVENKEIGIMNFVNPGTISLVDIKKKYNIINNINNNYEILNHAIRPSIILDTTRIEKYHPENINISIENILQTFYN
uniref:NAD-dependent epimerase/dehydratase domain-containing protein n=1 Tax=viral metagenome TaxID=1070528 RepID=A0A6C0HHE5_9ZZZZ